MNLVFDITSITIPPGLLILLGFVMAFGITWITIPSIVHISLIKNLYVMPNGRTSHINPTPSLGGIAVFAGLVLSTVIFAGEYFIFELKYIISGLIIVFFIGIKDDILVIDPVKKLGAQIFAVLLIAILADIRITNLYGLFHIGNLPYIVSILVTVFVFIVIINGFNLIDGIDGLASGIGILTSAVFGIWFWMTGNIEYTILSFSLVGTLTAFFYFNVFSKTNKIFLGDTGSMVTGFVLGILACRFLQLELGEKGTADIESAPTVVCGILIIPLFDTLRVFILRIKKGKSPFKADRKHIHHYFLRLGYTHLQTTAILISINLFFIVLSYALRGIGIIWLMGVILGLAYLLSYILETAVKRSNKKAIEAGFPVTATVKIMNVDNGRNKMERLTGKEQKKNVIRNYLKKITSDFH